MRRSSALALALCGSLLASCEDMSRQDPLLVRGSSNATVFANAPIYVDRPLAQNLTDSLAFADYDVLLDRAGLMNLLKGPGPYTVFAFIDPAIDDIPAIYRTRLLDPANAPALHAVMAYTIVPGRFTRAALLDMARRGGGRTALRTLDGAALTVAFDPTGRDIELQDPYGRVSRFVLADIRQSNGLLYAGTRLLTP